MHRNSLTDNADGGRSESIITTFLGWCTPLPINTVKTGVLKDLGFTKVHGDTRYNEAKNAEIRERKSM